MDSRTSRLLGPAERFYVGCDDEERRELDRILRNLCQDPKVNNMTTFVLSVPPAIMTLYRDGRFWIIYRTPDHDALVVYNIGPAPTKVNLRP